MAVTDIQFAHLGDDLWRMSWSSDSDGPFRVYRDGLLAAIVNRTDWTFSAIGADSPVFEILDDDAEPTAIFPPYLVLAWDGSTGTVPTGFNSSGVFRIEQLVGSDYVQRAEIADDGRVHFNWQSDTLADATTHTFRIVPVSPAGNEGTPLSFAVLMVRIPATPAASLSYDDSAHTVTVSIS